MWESNVQFYNFEDDFEYQIQLAESFNCRAALQCNKEYTDNYFQEKYEEGSDSNNNMQVQDTQLLSILPNEEMTNSVKEFLEMFKKKQEPIKAKPNMTIDENVNELKYLQIIKNLKQRISDVIKEKNSHYHLKKQITIMDSVSDILEQDPLSVLTTVGYEAILRNDEYNIPKTAKHIQKEVPKYEKKRQEMAEIFCLSDFSKDVITACDKFLEYKKDKKPLY